MTTSSQVSKLYQTVVDDVINNVKEAFLDEGVDEQVLQELKQLWESKLAASKALEPFPQEAEVVLAPSNVPMRMPQPKASAGAEAAAAAPSGHAQKIAGAVAQPPQTTLQYQPSDAAQAATMALPAGIFRQHLATLGAGGQVQNIAVQQTGSGQYITLPQFQTQQQAQPVPIQPQQPQQTGQAVRIPIQPQQQQQNFLQQQQQQQAQIFHAGQLLQQQLPGPGKGAQGLSQLDGNEDTSSSEDDDDFDLDDKDDEEKEEENEEEQREEEDPLNSADDVSDEDPTELFDTENVVVCQYDKINRNKNKWKFYLKDGIMNLNGRDFVFQKATGDAEW
ncbi:transcription initiation factor iia subunit 1-like [Plakobranchus ocellatus]|uniref:Transcription initiation factor iia subunit 1-like n=1 Tax=Plakobranchus ocellatus TaxID=259542 RepID=A0AAV4AYK7_9GAST|nr:transcription initiation factor iia subunit 1-like [Plakobranchus ocellatus]